ncbi:RNA polymerase sigma factor [Breznakia pachnodae]|uniref:RNA polymerase sigma factor (Sigma-70 family) n=1 Tax=Breznakia pachnodae TaxID=265178 RepID=A0ABU0E1M4_9FIRM|nr:RNA polymerase sigma factor [Breznakia pachnodae]MDQ0360716.1 RNA polymerase sigma factor (sigma-70 family) [Breznakia pachnodae]
MDKIELTQIVKEVQKDIGQFELLYSQIVNKVYYWCYTVIGNETEAKDAAQEAMIRIYKKIHTLKTPETFSSWMYILVRNVCYRYLEANRRQDKLYLDSNDFIENFELNVVDDRRDSIPNRAYDLKETKQLIVKLIKKLPKRQREVITLFYLEEMKINEIAEVLDYNAGSIRSRLHDGRKNLEQLIIEYQEKNNVKLYGLILWPLLGLILTEDMQEVCSKQDLAYDEKLFKQDKTSSLNRLLNWKLFITGAILIVAILVLFFVYWPQDTSISNNPSFLNDEELYNKIKGNPYVESIVYLSFSKRESVDITITLKENLDKKNIEILFNNVEIEFEKNNKEVFVQVTENGNYTIKINDTETVFEINKLNPYAPELIGVQDYGNYLQLTFNDEQSKINYEKSYIEYENKKYEITEKGKVYGNFNGIVIICLFDDEDQYIYYDADLNN